MKLVLDEYGEAIIGIVAVVLMTGIGIMLFQEGGMIEGFISDVANNAI